MKPKFKFLGAAAGVLLLALTTAVAQPGQPNLTPTPNAFQSPGMPAQPVAPAPPAPQFDPTTGLPVPSEEPQWIDPSWTDPNIIPKIVLTNVEYAGLPLVEVANHLRVQFKDHFDILPMPVTPGRRGEPRDWGSTIIQLQLKNVGPCEVFNAMNMVFENDQTPLRWQLRMNGNRPVAQLRVLPEGAQAPEISPPETHRMVYFVGNLIGDEKSGGMTMDQIVKTISTVWPSDFGSPDGVIQFHNEAQLLVVNGTRDQLDFISQTLKALGQKAELDRRKLDLQAQRESKTIQKTHNDDIK